MAQVGTTSQASNASVLYLGDETVSGDNEVVLETEDISRWTFFTLASTAGGWDVEVSLDGTTWITAPISLVDQGGISAAPVIAGVADRVYSFTAAVKKIRVKQDGGTDVENMWLRCSQERG